jgi:hypothetical protein
MANDLTVRNKSGAVSSSGFNAPAGYSRPQPMLRQGPDDSGWVNFAGPLPPGWRRVSAAEVRKRDEVKRDNNLAMFSKLGQSALSSAPSSTSLPSSKTTTLKLKGF